MSHRSVSVCALWLLLLSVWVRSGQAQAVLGPGENAWLAPRGVLRLRAVSSWTRWDERYGLNTPNREAGSTEPLGTDFSVDALGAEQLETLVPLRAGLRELTANPELQLSLGRSVLQLNASSSTIPLVAEFGVTDRLAISLNVPIVRTRTEAFFNLDPTGANLGFNPAMDSDEARAASSDLVAQFRAAAATLAQARASCQANPTAPGCPELNANGAAADALIAQATAFADGVARIYSDTGSALVPVAGTEADGAIRSRVMSLTTAFGGFGVGGITTLGPAAATRVLTVDEVQQQLLVDPAFGIAVEPLGTVERSGIGDIEFAATWQVLNSLSRAERVTPRGFNIRSAVSALARLGTGLPDSPDNLIDYGTGDGQHDVELRSYTDIVLGRRLWATVIGRYTWQLPDHEVLRITAPDRPFAEVYRRQRVERDLGDCLEVEVIPRLSLGDYFAIGARYLYRRRNQDDHTGTFDVANTQGETVTLDAFLLNLETRQREHRVGGGIAFSTIAAFERGRARFPLEVSYQYGTSVAGSGGETPKVSEHSVRLQVYLPLFGPGMRPSRGGS